MDHATDVRQSPQRRVLAGWLLLAAVSLMAGPAAGQGAVRRPAPAAAEQTASAASTPRVAKRSPYHPESQTLGARKFQAATAGVVDMKVRRTNAGNLIRFSYRVIDPDKAKALGDRQVQPYLVGHNSRAVLQVPTMDKVGPLRQAVRLDAGKEYWMVFSNKGDVVKPGERVSVVVGKFRVDGLLVE